MAMAQAIAAMERSQKVNGKQRMARCSCLTCNCGLRDKSRPRRFWLYLQTLDSVPAIHGKY